MKRYLILLVLLSFSCSEIETLGSSTELAKLSLSIQEINDPAPGTYYEAWMKSSNGSSESLGLLAKDQNSFVLETSPVQKQIFNNQLIYITIEKDDVPGMRFTESGDTIKAPSGNVVISSVQNANEGVFSLANGFITEPDNDNAVLNEFLFDNADASLIFYTATVDGDDNLSGVWFTHIEIDDTNKIFTSGLNMPAYNNGWLYEAILTIDGQDISMGTFSDPNLKDDSFTHSGPERNSYTSFPGEDFVNDPNDPPLGLAFPLDLTAGKISILLHPVYSDTTLATPFETTLFEGSIPSGYAENEELILTRVLNGLPTGSFTIEIDLYK